MTTPEAIQHYLAQGLNCQVLKVAGDGQHFEALIVSDVFAGHKALQRHRMVYDVLGDRMRAEIHALSMKTYTPDEWAAQQAADGRSHG